MLEKRIYTEDSCGKAVRLLYETAFPKEEQIPFAELIRLIPLMKLDFTVYYDGDELIGFTIVYPGIKFNWFWYFAVRKELRGHGYGQRILSRLLERYTHGTNILDMGSPEQDCENIGQRKRRHAFYRRNGFCDTGIGKSFEGIDYTIMKSEGAPFDINDYEQLLDELRSMWQGMPVPDNQRQL